MTVPVTVLVVAKAPVPGLAKTRLARTLGAETAADLAAAALLDTLDAVAEAPVAVEPAERVAPVQNTAAQNLSNAKALLAAAQAFSERRRATGLAA